MTAANLPEPWELYPMPPEQRAAIQRYVDRFVAQRDSERSRAAELQHVFDLQYTRMQEATAMWRAEAPAERELVSPDLGDLLTWLMGRPAAIAAAIERNVRHEDPGQQDRGGFTAFPARMAYVAGHDKAAAIARSFQPTTEPPCPADDTAASR